MTEIDMLALGRQLPSAAIDAFRHNCGLMVDFGDADFAFRRTISVPRGEVWTNRGMKIHAPSVWIEEANR